jgi:hypothetical protein
MTAAMPSSTRRPVGTRSTASHNDPAQFEHDGLFEYGASKQQLTVQEVAKGLGITPRHVLDLIDSGELLAAPINDQLDQSAIRNSQSAIRLHRRISRFSVVAFHNERLASEGQPILFRQTPQVIAWRNHLRATRGLVLLDNTGNPTKL